MNLSKKTICRIAKFTRKHPFKGLQRILNFIYPPSNINKIETVIDDYDNDLKIHINTSSFIEWFTFFKGYYEPAVTKIIKSKVKPGDTVIDVGANVGVHTLVMSKQVEKKGKVLAFEPHPEIANRLKINLKLNNQNFVQVIEKGLSNKQAKADFFIPTEKIHHKGISSLHKDHLNGNYKKIEVKVDTLDNFIRTKKINKVDLIKIDTEGNDFKVLLGAKEVIKDFSPDIIFEYEKGSWSLAGYDFSDVFDYLNQKGYNLFEVNKKGNFKKVNDQKCKPSMTVYAKK